MKKHITLEQSRELSHKQRMRLRHYHDKTGTAWSQYVDMGNTWPNPNIGDLIELLDHYSDNGSKYIDENGYEHCIGSQVATDALFDLGWSGDLCDALFEAVKRVLDEEVK